jgi:hypothetical protein
MEPKEAPHAAQVETRDEESGHVNRKQDEACY